MASMYSHWTLSLSIRQGCLQWIINTTAIIGKTQEGATIHIKINPFETPAIMRLSLLTFLIEGAPSLDWNPSEQIALHCERSADLVDTREEAEGVTGMKQVLWETWPQKQQRNLSITMVWYYIHPYFIFQSKLQPLCDHTQITLILRSYLLQQSTPHCA